MEKIIIKGRAISKGVAEGEALVTKQPISFLGGIDPNTGIMIEKGHELEGQSVAGKVLIFPGGKGSTAGSFTIYSASRRGTAPVAMINLEAEPIIATGAVMSEIPLLDRLERNPIEVIKNKDWVRVDGEKGVVEVIRVGKK